METDKEISRKFADHGLTDPREELKSIKAAMDHMNEVYGKAQNEYETKIKNLTAHINSDIEIQRFLSERINQLSDCLGGILHAAEEAVEIQFPPELIKKMRTILNPTGIESTPAQEESQEELWSELISNIDGMEIIDGIDLAKYKFTITRRPK